MQIFTKSNRQWFAKELAQESIDAFKQAAQQSMIKPIIAHASYLINVGSPKEDVQKKAKKALKDELERCNLLGITTLVVHPGSHLKTDETTCLERIAHTINEIFAHYKGDTTLSLEIMAGQGSSVCYNFEQLAYVISLIKQQEKVGVCFDTCHAFAAGYDFSSKATYNAMWDNFDNTIGLEKLHVIHLNDSKKERGSRVDRHENIGKGKIGLSAFELLCNDERLFDVPKVLETPDGTLEDYAKDLATLKALLSPATKKSLELAEK